MQYMSFTQQGEKLLVLLLVSLLISSKIGTNIYSVLSLYDILDQGDFQCWQHFVLASRLLTQPVISISDLHLADALLMQFCRRVERKYGKNMITSNMHMHGHLKECILDFGPIHNFWCLSFERYNGILENYPTITVHQKYTV